MFEWSNWWGTLAAMGIALGANVALAGIMLGVRATAGKRMPWLRSMGDALQFRAQILVLIFAAWAAFGLTAPATYDWWSTASRVFFIAVVAAGAWLLAGFVSFGFGRVLGRYQLDEASLPEVRRMRTQLQVISRLSNVLIGTVALGVVLFSFPEVRAVGTSVLASAGIVSVIAGMAAQTTLGNLIAGIQLAFSNAVRVGDVVVVEDEWGTIGEITLSYVVVHIWDERRLVLPCTYFATRPYESWTRNSPLIKGTVYLDVDWRVPIPAVRAKFMEFVQTSEWWDKRGANMVVTDASGGHVTVRFTVSAKDSDDVWYLRCALREEMVIWLQREHPDAMPVTRVLLPGAGEGSTAQ